MTDEPQIQRSAVDNHLLEGYIKPRPPVDVLFILLMPVPSSDNLWQSYL